MIRILVSVFVLSALFIECDAFHAPGVRQLSRLSSNNKIGKSYSPGTSSNGINSNLFASTSVSSSDSNKFDVKKVISLLKTKIISFLSSFISILNEFKGKILSKTSSSTTESATKVNSSSVSDATSSSTPMSARDKALESARKYAADKLREIDDNIKKTAMLASSKPKAAVEEVTTIAPITISDETLKKLEAEPYYDMSNIPMQTYKAKEPYVGKVVSVKRIVGAAATGETCNIVIDHKGEMPYWEGQSYGVIPPGINPKNDKPYTNRLYSIASSRYGDDMKGTTTTLCVRRATYWCPELQAEDPAKKGVCSNYLCDAKPGDEVNLTGPSGKVMLMPESKPETDLIMVATGTGIAPYRSFWKRLFIENTPAAEAFKGQAWLFLGVANTDALLYDDELQEIKKKNPEQFRLDYALSREQTNKSGGKMYIQDKVEEYADEIFAKLDAGAHIYFCGLKGMMPGILTMLDGVATAKGLVWKDKLKEFKENGQWHVEVY